MKTPVKLEHVQCFDDLYHQLLKQNLTIEDNYPKELKNLTAIDIAVISIIASNSDVIVREIAESLKIPNSTLTSSLNRLEEKEIANRVISRRDRRSFSIALTEKGREVQQMHLDFEKAYFENILSRLDTNEERDAFLKLCKKVAAPKPDM